MVVEQIQISCNLNETSQIWIPCNLMSIGTFPAYNNSVEIIPKHTCLVCNHVGYSRHKLFPVLLAELNERQSLVFL